MEVQVLSRPQVYKMKKKENKEDKMVGMIRVTGKGVGYFSMPDLEQDYEVQPENLNKALLG